MYRKVYKAYYIINIMEFQKNSAIIFNDDIVQKIKEEFRDFVNLNKKEIMNSINSLGDCNIDLTELRDESSFLYKYIIDMPENTLGIMNNVLKNDILFNTNDEPIRFVNFPQLEEKFIRDIRSCDLNTLICTEALIRQVTNVKTIIDEVVFECPSCCSVITINQKGDTLKEPTHCSCGRRGGFKQIKSISHDVQIMSIEEKHEDTDNNHQPERIKMYLNKGLTDKDHTINHIPGSVVKVIGIVKEETKYVRGNNVSRISEKYLEVNNIFYVEDNFLKVELNDDDINKIKQIANEKDTLNIISRSIVPSTIGYDSIKRSLSLMIFGGVKNKRSDGSYTREFINGLIVGDAGLSKSVMLKAVSSLIPRGRFVSGRGVSGAGITATVLKSELTGDYTLEGGALIMANGSILAVDEAEKIKAEDIANLHESMSIGTVTIDKATIHACLPARTSILAAANPKWGRFKNDVDVYSQINFPPALLSRFDFIYIIRDIPNEETDGLIAEKILSEHMNEEHSELLNKEFIRKYIFYAKQINPKLTKESNNEIMKFYLNLRKQSKENGEGQLLIPITPRQLESLVRLSEAHARMKLHDTVTIDDTLQAIKIFKEYLIEFGYDEKNGAFDVDKIMGVNKSNMSIMDAIIMYIKSVRENFLDGYVPINIIEDEFRGKVEDKKFDAAIFNLNKDGTILKSTRGYKLMN